MTIDSLKHCQLSFTKNYEVYLHYKPKALYLQIHSGNLQNLIMLEYTSNDSEKYKSQMVKLRVSVKLFLFSPCYALIFFKFTYYVFYQT